MRKSTAQFFVLLFVLSGIVLPCAYSQSEINVQELLRLQPNLRLEPENGPPAIGIERPLASDVDLRAFYQEFVEDGAIRIYFGMGQDAYMPGTASYFRDVLKKNSEQMGLHLSDWSVEGERITFKDESTNISYVVQIGHERNEFIEAFADYEVVFYHGHSRYGRGPSFDGYSNYYRMGDVFRTIEVDTLNSYFQNEPILQTDVFPLFSMVQDGEKYFYQYIGQKDHSSYLDPNSHVKIIEGGDKDLRNTSFLPKRQILFFHSCSNVNYWASSLRAVFENSPEKLLIGTTHDVPFDSLSPAILINHIVMQTRSAQSIVNVMNSAYCKNCFTIF